MYATRAATPLAESHPFKFATAYRTVANGKRGRAPAPPTSAFYTRVYTCPSTSTPYLLLLPIPHARKPSYALTNLQRSERERERVVGSRGRRRDSKSLAVEKDKEGVEEEPRVQGSSLDAVVIPETDGLRQQTPCNLYLPARLPPACNNAPGLKPPPFERGSSQSWDLPRILPAIIINYLGNETQYLPISLRYLSNYPPSLIFVNFLVQDG